MTDVGQPPCYLRHEHATPVYLNPFGWRAEAAAIAASSYGENRFDTATL
jgi:hypothetical protein